MYTLYLLKIRINKHIGIFISDQETLFEKEEEAY